MSTACMKAESTVIIHIESLFMAKHVKTKTFPNEYKEMKQAKRPKYGVAPSNDVPKRRWTTNVGAKKYTIVTPNEIILTIPIAIERIFPTGSFFAVLSERTGNNTVTTADEA